MNIIQCVQHKIKYIINILSSPKYGRLQTSQPAETEVLYAPQIWEIFPLDLYVCTFLSSLECDQRLMNKI